ncbi:MAG: FAD-dependent oxidoreductase [Holophagales bacterium]|nr:FAD-dependent oxidoreductase [Holophagales bacterium]MYG28875.1 FAD-dependent oxidoreductase [Holophagales bacterium]MYI80803.1 FAD-dependent oxidoreductase [Holophagales bacterium]
MFAASSYDVIVIGAGPGGSAAAAIAARGGLRVLLLEREPAPMFKIGESLMPDTHGVFEKMGALRAMQESHFVEKHSVQFFTKTGKASMPFYFEKERPGEDSARTWQVRRSEFDQLLMETAAGQGAEVHRGVNVRDVLFEGGRAVGVRAAGPSKDAVVELAGRVIIDATGQSAMISRRLDLGRIDYGLRHASIYTHFRGAIRDEGKDEGATLILHTKSGECWFWYIPLAGDVVSVGVVGPMDALIRKRDGRPHEIFFEEVRNCGEIERRIAPAHQCRPVSVMKDFSYRIEKMAGDGWIAIGDAFSFIDPVYSSGVFLALKSGEMAAEAAIGAIAADDLSGERLGAFRPLLMRGVEAVRQLVNVFYDPNFSVGAFLRLYPQHQSKVTRILIGDVFEVDFTSMFDDMATFAAGGGGRAMRAPEAATAATPQSLQAT